MLESRTVGKAKLDPLYTFKRKPVLQLLVRPMLLLFDQNYFIIFAKYVLLFTDLFSSNQE